MQYVNDDMDDLFRSAAEHYHLHERGADWAKIAAALDNKAGEEPIEAKRGNKHLVWLICIMPVLVCNKPFTRSSVHTGNKTEQTLMVGPSIKNRLPATVDHDTAINTGVGTISFSPDKTMRSDDLQANTVIYPPVSAFRPPAAYSLLPTDKETATDEETLLHTTTIKDATKETPAIVSPVNVEIASTAIPVSTGVAVKTVNNGSTEVNDIREDHPPMEEKTKDTQLQKTGERKSSKKFYAVLTGGLDASSVRLQKIEKAGHHYGGLLGYRVNKKWSVEAGLLIEKKYYYTEGRYFNTSGVYMPANSKITEVSGDCKMFELPLAVQYNFSERAHSSWFAAAGISSYIMKSEHYDYLYYYGNTGTQANHEKTYKNQSKNLFSVIQLSAGYTRKIGKTTALRVEPYFKLPVSGIGYGKLPLLSKGIHLGIIKDLF